MDGRQNTFSAFLKLLKVKHTKSFSDQYFNEHPRKNNLYGLSKMLSDYGIRNAATRIEDKENDLFNLECPFVAYAGGEFVVVEKVSPTPALPQREGETEESGAEGVSVHFIRKGKRLIAPIAQFIQSWSGVILLAETSPDSIEPDYTEHRKRDWLIIAQKSILALACILLLGIAYINNLFSPSLLGRAGERLSLCFSLLLFVNFIGIYICYLLVLKQLHIQSRYADKICTLFSQSDCNNVLESDAAKLWGIFGWSEIGMGYFAANTVMLLFLPHLFPYIVLINILSLPFTVWSVWYQKVKARQWCPLCLIVQGLLWAIFIINLIFDYIQLPDFNFFSLNSTLYTLLTLCCYVVPAFTLNLLLPKLSEGNQVEQLRQEINSIKANEEAFKTLLLQQPFYEVSLSDSRILFGNPDSKLKISIFTNPFCNPCAKMHVRVEKLLKETKGEVCIQYIFSAFNEDLNYANRYFNAIYLGKGSTAAMQIYTEWFEKGKALKEAFFDDLQLDMTNPIIEEEFQKHESWKEKTQLRATPTILVNGYKLPDNYKIEDLRFLRNPISISKNDKKVYELRIVSTVQLSIPVTFTYRA